MNIKETIELHLAWRRRDNLAPLVVIYAPVPTPYPGFDMTVDPKDIVSRKLANLRAGAAVPHDTLPVGYVNYGTAFLPALAGAGFEYDGHTSWSLPCADSLAGLKIRAFDPEHPLWISFAARFRPLLENWSWDTYLPGPSVMLGPMDVLSGLIGPQNLALALHQEPEEVRRCARDAARLCLDYFQIQVDMIRQAGLTEGLADWMGLWLPGYGACYSEDFSALCGEPHFRDFFLEPNETIMGQMDSAMLHLHSAGLACLPAILELKGLKSLEISNDPNGPNQDAILAAARRVQATGRPLQLSNWNRPLAEAEMERIFSSLSPCGLCISLQATSLDEARALYARAKRMKETRAGYAS